MENEMMLVEDKEKDKKKKNEDVSGREWKMK